MSSNSFKSKITYNLFALVLARRDQKTKFLTSFCLSPGHKYTFFILFIYL